MAEGHSNARHYVLAELWSEAARARKRVNRRIATEAVAMQAVVVSVLSGDVNHLKKIIEDLNHGD